MRTTMMTLTVGSLLAIAATVPGTALAQPSSDLADYALLADTKFVTKGLTLGCGDLGVNQTRGRLVAPRYLTAPGRVASDIVKLGANTAVGELFANLLLGPHTPPATPWTPPLIVPDIQTACGFPVPFPACNLANPVQVDAGTTTALPPGAYGDLVVKGGFDEFGFPNPGVLELGGGVYTFCSVKLGKFAEVRFTAPATVNVVTNLRMQGGNRWGSVTGAGVTPDQIVVYVGGSKVHYSRGSQVEARLCAPLAKCRLTKGGSHAGAVYCRFIRTEEITFVCSAGAGSPSGAFID